MEGFSCAIGASGTFCPKHVTLPVTAFFFNLSDDNAPSPYLVSHLSMFLVILKSVQHNTKTNILNICIVNEYVTLISGFCNKYISTNIRSISNLIFLS